MPLALLTQPKPEPESWTRPDFLNFADTPRRGAEGQKEPNTIRRNPRGARVTQAVAPLSDFSISC